MPHRSESTRAIWLVCIGIGLLFLARGAFQPYAFPLFEHLGAHSYAQIALLLNVYIFAQSICAPAAGWFTDRTSVRTALAASIASGLASFLVIAARPGYWLCVVAVFAAGVAFVLGKIAMNTLLVLHSSESMLRRSVAKRATLVNLGSFVGNSIAFQMTTRVGYRPLAILLGLLHLPLAIGLAASPAHSSAASETSQTAATPGTLLKNKGFLGDCLRRFAIVLPYGCWGTVIPKYVIDQYHSSEKVWLVYLTSLCTTVLGAHFLAVYASPRLYRRGFKWEWWSMLSVVFYCSGLLLLVFASRPILLLSAVAVFICGEVVMTPCFDETAKRHGGVAGMGRCMGLLHLVDGFGRMLGAAFALAVYGWMRLSPHRDLYWPVVVGVFLFTSSALHVVAFGLTRPEGRAASGRSPLDATPAPPRAMSLPGNRS